MLKTIREYGLLFAAFVTVIPCPALHCRPGTFWTYPLIFTLMLLSCLLASAAVFLFRRSALFLLLPLGAKPVLLRLHLLRGGQAVLLVDLLE